MGIICWDGSPTVVFIALAGTVGLDYYVLQQKVSDKCSAFIYDRMWIGYSSYCILPRTSKVVVEELHELWEIAKLRKPFIIVGHSLGGLYARHFAILYQNDVFGLVLLDPAHEYKVVNGVWNFFHSTLSIYHLKTRAT